MIFGIICFLAFVTFVFSGDIAFLIACGLFAIANAISNK